MNVVKFQPTSRNSSPWLYRPSWTLGLSRYRLIKYSVIIGAFAVLFVASILNGSIDATPPISIGVASITVVDGDTVRANGQTYRLVGFDTPESGSLARCERERKLVANGQPGLERVPCSCPPGTEGTQQCNHGRLCARLRAEGRDVGTILINE